MRNWVILNIFILNIFLMNSCTRQNAALIVTNAKVYTVDSLFSTVESFAVNEGKIIATGTSKEILRKFTSGNIVYAGGKYVYPGFNDAHCHFTGYASNLTRYADLRGTTSREEIYGLLKKHHETYGGDWILGRNWDQNDWTDKQFPDNQELGKLFPNNPVYLVRVDGHAAWCNPRAIEIAGIDKNTKSDGGEIKLKNNVPTGVLIDNAMWLVAKHIPEMSRDLLTKGLIKAQENCFAVGLTSLSDAGVDFSEIQLYNELIDNKILKIRINAMLSPSKQNLEEWVKKGPQKKEKLTINTIKLFADGALGSRGARLLGDYSDDPGNQGLQIETNGYYDEICRIAFENNYIVATHAIGDSANRLMLNTYGKFLKGANNRRWRIEHAQVVHPDDFQKFARFSVVPSIQATHATSDMYWAKDRLGDDRVKGAYAYQTLLKQNGWLPNGTDFPVENIEPLYTFYASVFRTDHKGFPQGGWQMADGLTREQTLRSMTIWAAKAEFNENEKGSVEPGKWADFVILDTDLMTASPSQVLNAKILSTWVGGEKVY